MESGDEENTIILEEVNQEEDEENTEQMLHSIINKKDFKINELEDFL